VELGSSRDRGFPKGFACRRSLFFVSVGLQKRTYFATLSIIAEATVVFRSPTSLLPKIEFSRHPRLPTDSALRFHDLRVKKDPRCPHDSVKRASDLRLSNSLSAKMSDKETQDPKF